MFDTFNPVEFGEYIRRLRKERKLSQQNVVELTSISRDTIRRIENGKVIPRYDTISLLSKCYGTNLFDIFSRKVKHPKLVSFHKQLDRIIFLGDENEIVKFTSQFREFIAKDIYDLNILDPLELDMISKLLAIIEQYYKPISKNEELLIENTIELLSMRHKSFKLKSFNNHIYNYIELRALHLLSVVYHDVDMAFSLKISLYILELIKNDLFYDIEHNFHLHIRLLYNISYAYYLKKEDRKSLHYSEQGLILLKENYSYYLLHNLLYRKGIACYYLNDKCYSVYLNKSLTIIKMEGNEHLYNKYITSLKDVHSIFLENHQ